MFIKYLRNTSFCRSDKMKMNFQLIKLLLFLVLRSFVHLSHIPHFPLLNFRFFSSPSSCSHFLNERWHIVTTMKLRRKSCSVDMVSIEEKRTLFTGNWDNCDKISTLVHNCDCDSWVLRLFQSVQFVSFRFNGPMVSDFPSLFSLFLVTEQKIFRSNQKLKHPICVRCAVVYEKFHRWELGLRTKR